MENGQVTYTYTNDRGQTEYYGVKAGALPLINKRVMQMSKTRQVKREKRTGYIDGWAAGDAHGKCRPGGRHGRLVPSLSGTGEGGLLSALFLTVRTRASYRQGLRGEMDRKENSGFIKKKLYILIKEDN